MEFLVFFVLVFLDFFHFKDDVVTVVVDREVVLDAGTEEVFKEAFRDVAREVAGDVGGEKLRNCVVDMTRYST